MLILAAALNVKGQDIHFTQWFFAPHSYNPAELGNFNGDYRFHANHRNQWSSVTVPFQTFALMAESKVLTKNENLAIGANIIYDLTGDSKFSTTAISPVFSYTFSLKGAEGGFSKGNFSIGIQPSLTQKKINQEALFFDNQFNGNYFDPNLPINESLPRLSRWYFDVAFGTRLFLSVNKTNSAEAGISAFNLLKPKQSFFNQDDIKLDRRFNFYFKWNHTLNKQMTFQPGLLLSDQGKFNSFNLGMKLFYDISESLYLKKKLFFGLYGRAADSGNLIAGMIYDSWTFSGSYDFNLSTLVPASNYRGGLELAVIYVIRKGLKRPAYKSCPPYL